MKKLFPIILSLVVALSMAACGSAEAGQTGDLDVTEAYIKLSEGVTLPEMLELDQDLMLDYCGIRAEDVTEAKVVICADSLRTDEIWVVEAKDSATAATIKALAEKRLEKKGEESITYSPEQYAVVEKAELVCTGNFVVLLVSPDSAKMAENFRQYAGI